MKDIWCKLHAVQGKVTRIFKKASIVTKALANEMIGLQQTKEFYSFMDLSTNIRRCINIDKSEIPYLKIRTYKTNKQ